MGRRGGGVVVPEGSGPQIIDVFGQSVVVQHTRYPHHHGLRVGELLLRLMLGVDRGGRLRYRGGYGAYHKITPPWTIKRL